MSERAEIVLGLFESPDTLMVAISELKPKNLGRLEAYTPYPIHGIDVFVADIEREGPA